jgi:hypothetical protein
MKELDVSSVSKIVAYFVFTALGYFALNNVESMSASLQEIEKSISSLNAKMAVVVLTQESHRDRIDDHEIRIRKVEQTKK